MAISPIAAMTAAQPSTPSPTSTAIGRGRSPPVAEPAAPGGVDGEHDSGAGQEREHPAPPLAEGALGAAADELELLIEGGEGLALLSETEDEALPDQEPAERDNERGDPAVGDDEPLQGADQCAERDADQDGHDPRVRPFQTEVEVFGIHFVWTIAIVYPRKPSSDPTERSMLRDTMMRTMPSAGPLT